MVNFIRRYVKGSFTLAIGDGANDVNMIQAGHVGIGIMGKEDNQAASFSDYAIPQFKDLRTLLFNHGRGFAVRAVNYLSWCIWKSSLFSIPMIYYNTQNGFSGQTFLEDWFYAVYDVINNEWALFFYVLYEQDVSIVKPHLNIARYYGYCRECILPKNLFYYFLWFAYAFWSGAVMYYVPAYVFGEDSIVTEDGFTDGVWTAGVICMSILIITHHVLLVMGTKNFTWFTITIYIFSVFLFFPLTLWLNDETLGAMTYKSAFTEIFATWHCWLCLVLCSVLVVLPYQARNAVY